jgi:bifunctional non-homologous end joining protein LigD
MSKVPKHKPNEMPAFVEPCLATLVAEPPDGPLWAHEIKYDGYRLQARIENGTVQLLTRSGLDWTEKFADLASSLKALKVSSAIIDGEIVVEDERGASSFVKLVSDLKAKQSERMIFVAFDLLFLEGANIRALPLAKRKAKLMQLCVRRKKVGKIRYSEHVAASGGVMLAQACKLGLEGIVSKRLDKTYRSGRGTDWLKSKCILTDEFVVVGYLNSNAEENAVGALVLGYYQVKKLIYAGRVGTGFNNREARELWKKLQKLRRTSSVFTKPVAAIQAKGVVWVKPNLVAQVEYRAWTADGILRHASFKALRDDKAARHVCRPSNGR